MENRFDRNVENPSFNNTITKLIKQLEPCMDDMRTLCELENIMEGDKNGCLIELRKKLSKWNIKVKENHNGNSNESKNKNDRIEECNNPSHSNSRSFIRTAEHELLNNSQDYIFEDIIAKKNNLANKINEFMAEKDRIKNNLNTVIQDLTVTEIQNEELKSNMLKFSKNIATEKLVLMKTATQNCESNGECSSNSVMELFKKNISKSDTDTTGSDCYLHVNNDALLRDNTFITTNQPYQISSNCSNNEISDHDYKILKDSFTQTQLQTLEEEPTSKQSQMLNLLSEVDLLKQEINQTNEIKKALAKLKNENDELRERFSVLLESNLKDKSYLDSYLIGSYQSQIVDYEEQKSKLFDELNVQKDNVQNNLCEINELKRHNAELRSRNNKQEELIENLYNECDMLKDYQKQYVEKMKENEELNKQVDDNQKIHNELGNAKRQNEDTISELQKELLKKECKINDLNRALEANRWRLLENEKITNKMIEETKICDQLKNDNEQLQNLIRFLQENETTAVKSRKTNKGKSNKSLERRKNASRQMKLQLKEQIQRLKEGLHQERNGLKLYQSDFLKQRHQFDLELQNIKQEKSDLQIRIFELENKKHELKNNLNDLENQMNNSKINFENLSLEKIVLQDNNSKLNEKLQKRDEENVLLSSNIFTLEGKLEEYESDLRELEENNKFLRAQVQDAVELKKQQYDIKLLFDALDRQTENLDRSASGVTTIWNNELANIPRSNKRILTSNHHADNERDHLYLQVLQIEERIKSTASLLEILAKSKDELLAKHRSETSTVSCQTVSCIVKKPVKKFTIMQPNDHFNSIHKEYEVRYFRQASTENIDCNSSNNLQEENVPDKSLEEIMHKLIYLTNDNPIDVADPNESYNTLILALMWNRLKLSKKFNNAAISSQLDKLNEVVDAIPEDIKQILYKDIDNFIADSCKNCFDNKECFQQDKKLMDFCFNLAMNNNEEGTLEEIALNKNVQRKEPDTPSWKLSQKTLHKTCSTTSNPELTTQLDLYKLSLNIFTMEYRFIVAIFCIIFLMMILSKICTDIKCTIVDRFHNKINCDTFNWIDVISLISKRWQFKRINPV